MGGKKSCFVLISLVTPPYERYEKVKKEKALLTDDQIKSALKKVSLLEPFHNEHYDCVRIAYEWLDAQKKIKGTMKRKLPLKHIVESWGSRYVSTTDVEAAAILHPLIVGKYPSYNLSARLVRPSDSRLNVIGEAGKHEQYRSKHDRDAWGIYKGDE